MRRFACILALAAATGPAGAQLSGTFTPGEHHPGKPKVGMGEIREDPERIKERMRAGAREHIELADRYLAEQRWGKAREELDVAQGLAVDASLRSALQSRYEKIDAEGHRQLAEVEAVYESGDYARVVEQLQRISRVFDWLPSGEKARRGLENLSDDPEAQAALRESSAGVLARVAERALDAAERASGAAPATAPASQPATGPDAGAPPTRVERIRRAPVETQDRVVRVIENVAERFDDTPTGEAAAADLQTLRDDAAFQASLAAYRARREADRALARAKMYEESGVLSRAVEHYRRVVTDFPDTPQAREATVRIGVLEARLATE